MPEPSAALKNFTDFGGVEAAGMTSGYETLLVGCVQVEPAAHEEFTGK